MILEINDKNIEFIKELGATNEDAHELLNNMLNVAISSFHQLTLNVQQLRASGISEDAVADYCAGMLTPPQMELTEIEQYAWHDEMIKEIERLEVVHDS